MDNQYSNMNGGSNSNINNNNSNNNQYVNNNNHNNQYINNNNQYINNNGINNYASQYGGANKNYQIIDDKDLLETFIGNNSYKLLRKSFNFSAFFFTTLYFFYRKMFLAGIVVFFISNVLFNVFKNGIVMLLFSLVIGFIFNKLYAYHAIRKTAKIKNRTKDVALEDLYFLCRQKGGTSILDVILGIIVCILGVIACAFLGFTKYFAFDMPLVFLTNLFNINSTEFNGTIVYDTTINMQSEFRMSIPGVFEDFPMGSYAYGYEYKNPNNTLESCNVSLLAVKNQTNSSEFIKKMADFYKESNSSEINELTVNNINWQWCYYKNSLGTFYNYLTTKDKKVYLFKYEVYNDGECLEYKNEILNSIEKVE